MTGFSSLIAPLLVVVGRHGEADLDRPHPPALPVSSVGLGSPSLTANPLMALIMLPVTLDSPISAVLVLETRKLSLAPQVSAIVSR